MSGQNFIDWDDAFNTFVGTDDMATLVKLWSTAADATRRNLDCTLDIPYENHERSVLDLFTPGPKPKGLVVFFHGGFWRRLDKSFWSHMAQGPLANGWAVAIPSYPLAPKAKISQITKQAAKAVEKACEEVDGPVHLVGHSAGGHLVSRLASVDGPLEVNYLQRIKRVVSVSGVHDLRPLVLTAMNEDLQLTAKEAETESPIVSKPIRDCDYVFWVGAKERPEFLRQTRAMAEKWQRLGASVSETYDIGQDHFTVVASLDDPESGLTRVLVD